MDDLKALDFPAPIGSLTLSVRDVSALLVFSALAVHVVFNRWEPLRLDVVLPLLLLLPVTLSSLLAAPYGLFAALGLGMTTFYLTLGTSISLYRLSPMHPLARYPGPVLFRISKLVYIWKVWNGKQHLYLKSLHERYGDVVRTGPNDVSIRDASSITPVLGAHGMPKGPMYEGRHMWPDTVSVIGMRDSTEHQRRRRPWNRAFNTSSVKEFTPVIQNRVQQLVEALGVREGQTLDLGEWIGFFTYDFMGDMVFGGWTDMVKEGADHNGLWGLVKSGVKSSFFYENVPWLSYYAKMLPGLGNDVKIMRAMGFARTEKRYATGSTSRDLFHFLGNEDGKEPVDPPKHIVISDGVTALVAGSDTTATVLSSTFYCLMRHPEMYQRLQAEVDKFYPPGENSLDPVHIADMHFLNAVIMETTRLFPAVPSGSQRAPEKGKGGKMIGNYYIPEGTQTRVHFWSVQRDPRNFSYPENFWPDRWLIVEGLQEHPEKIVHNANAWIPFSFGPANCVGKNLAMQEMRIVICHFMQKLNIRFANGYNPAQYEDDMRDMFIMGIGKLPVVVERRD